MEIPQLQLAQGLQRHIQVARLRAKVRAAVRFGLLRLQQGPAQRLSRRWSTRPALLGARLRQPELKAQQTQKSLQEVVLEVAEVEAVGAAEEANAAQGNDKQRPPAQLVTQVRKQRAAFRRMGGPQQLVRSHVSRLVPSHV